MLLAVFGFALFGEATLTEQQITGTAIAGWSSFGMAGGMVAWLIWKHIPRLMDENKAERENHKLEQAASRVSFQAAIDKVVSHCEEESANQQRTFLEAISRMNT